MNNIIINAIKIWLCCLLLLSNISVNAQQVGPVDNIPTTPSPPNTTQVEYPGLYDMTSTGKVNYVKTVTPDAAYFELPASGCYSRVTTQYTDGIGRPLETIAKKAHADGNDIVIPYVYDNFGRQAYQYLPFAAPLSHISIINPAGKLKWNINTQLRGFYDNAGVDEEPYGKTEFDYSPLNRVKKQLAPGSNWVGSNRGVTFQYKCNLNPIVSSTASSPPYTIIGCFPKFSIGNNMGDIPVYNSDYNYEQKELFISGKKDEDGNYKEEIRDKMGKILMVRSLLNNSTVTPNAAPELFADNFAYTIYVYDDLNRLRVVMPPEACKPTSQWVAGSGSAPSAQVYSWDIDEDKLDGLCYQYLYDKYGRQVEKKIPGKDAEYFVYDRKDRLILSQDGKQRAEGNKWTFLVYDIMDRPLFSGIYTFSASRTFLQNQVYDNITYPTNTLMGTLKSNTLYHSYPSYLIGCKFLSFNYYDDYNYTAFNGFDFESISNSYYPNPMPAYLEVSNKSNLTRGLPTGTKTRVMDPNDPDADNWLIGVIYYDDAGRPIQTKSQNMEGGIDVSSNIYYFQGMLYRNIMKHQNPNAIGILDPNGNNTTAINEYTIQSTLERNIGVEKGDGQIWSYKQKINNGAEYPLAYYDYDHLGRQTIKQFTAGLNLQEYNMRGFPNHIAFKNYDQNMLFEEKMFYDDGFGSKLYNGNIAGITWAGSDHQVKSYGYSYDKLNRLTHAEFRQWDDNNSNWSNDVYDYTVSNITYDLNGNIKTMNQMVTPLLSNDPKMMMDELTYAYAPNSNRLLSVEDATAAAFTEPLGLPDFKDNEHSDEEYHYDANGNMVSDDNKKVTTIRYNYLDKPETVQVDGKGTITYVYDAAGNRLQKRIVDLNDNSNNANWDYIGNFIYKNGQLQYMLTEEGRARPVPVEVANSNGEYTTKFVYDYFVKDHLGNVRSTVTATPDAQQYYARHEIASANIEELVFDHIPEVREIKPGSIELSDKYAARLNGNDPQKRIGTAIMLHTKPGDKLNFNVSAFYDGDYRQDRFASGNEMVNSLYGALMGGTSAGTPLAEMPENMQLIDQVFKNPELGAQIEDLIANTENPDAPKAHLNYLWFNDKLELDAAHSGSFQVVQNANGSSGWVSIGTETSMQGGGTVLCNHCDFISPSSGILLVYIDNQSIGKDVWFDNLIVSHYGSEVVEEDHYYPFGLTLNTTQAPIENEKNPYKYNTKELERSFGLEIYDYGARPYDPQIGRWMAVDAFAENYAPNSPYNYVSNNPIVKIDPDGNNEDWYTHDNEDGTADAIFVPGNAPTVTGNDGKTYQNSGSTMVGTNKDGSGWYGNADGTMTMGLADVEIDGTPSSYGYYNVAQAARMGLGDTPEARARAKMTDETINAMLGFMGAGGALPFVGIAAVEAAPIVITTFLSNPAGWTGLGGSTILGSSGYAGEMPGINLAGLGGVCFVEGTKIKTQNGDVKIENIKIGDSVWSYNCYLRQNELKKVTKCYVTKDVQKVLKIEIGTEVIFCTPEHPFYIKNKWVAAKDLKTNDTVTVFSNLPIVITGKENLDTLVNVYNFTVKDNHNYFVSGSGVLVHNSCQAEVGVAEGGLPARIFSSKAPMQVTPGIAKLSGQYIDDLERVQPWKAAYDKFGRLFERTDWNAANKAFGVDAIHHHIYEYLPKTQIQSIDHIPGVGPNTGW